METTNLLQLVPMPCFLINFSLIDFSIIGTNFKVPVTIPNKALRRNVVESFLHLLVFKKESSLIFDAILANTRRRLHRVVPSQTDIFILTSDKSMKFNWLLVAGCLML